MAGPRDPMDEVASETKQRFAAELYKAVQRVEKRLGRAVNRAKLAKTINVAPASVYAYLKGTTVPNDQTLEKLLDALAVAGPERGLLGTLREEAEAAVQRARRHRTESALQARHPTPRQLPAHTSHFVGRAEQLRQLTELLDLAASDGATAVISSINGTAGIGKTTLALHWAHRIADRFPDGQLYVNLRGFDPTGSPMAPAEAVRMFLDAFQVAPARIPTGFDAQAALYRSLLADRRMLIVLDNAHDTDQVRALLPGSPTCLVVVTSRDQLTGLVATAGARPVLLDLFTFDEARDLLTSQISDERVHGAPEAVAQLITRCARLPLALAIVAARVAVNPRLSLPALAGQLQDARTRLDALDAGDAATDLRAVFSWSYQQLDEEPARMFRLLGLHPGPDLSLTAAASLAGVPVDRAREALNELARATLIEESSLNRFAFHDLLRAYAASQVQALDDVAERRTAVNRMLDHYLHTANAAARVLESNQNPLAVTPILPGVSVDELTHHNQAMTWCETERAVLLKVIEQAAGSGFDTHAWQIPACLGTFLDRRGHWQNWATTHRTALAAAERIGDRHAQARIHRAIGQAAVRLGSFEDAHVHLHHALDLFARLDDRPSQARTHLVFAVMFEHRKRPADSLHHAQQALNLFRADDNRPGQALALNGVGWYLALLDDHDQALAHCDDALALFHELEYPRGEAATWDSLGYIHHSNGSHDEAARCYEQALTLYRQLGDRYAEATTLTRLGDTHHATGNRTAAQSTWQQAEEILDELHHPDADQVRAKLSQP